MHKIKNSIPESLLPFSETIRNSMRFYEQTRFNNRHDTLLKAFVDIIHNDYSLNWFFQICVTVPLFLNNLQSRFYIYEKRSGHFLLVSDSTVGLLKKPQPADFGLDKKPWPAQQHDNRLFYPLYPHTETGSGIHFPARDDRESDEGDPYFAEHSLLGMYAISPVEKLESEDRAFFDILSRWMGHKLDNRLNAERHQEHLHFLNSLGRDIGHNIIVPNMYLKHLLRQVEKQISDLKEVEHEAEHLVLNGITTRQYVNFLVSCREKREALEKTHRELLKHHKQITLYLESLFREQHFIKGHLVLQPARCFVERDIILPQLDLYRKKLEQQGVSIEKPLNLYKQEFPLMVDIGLLSQVYANLFSNAVKYTAEIIDHQGKIRKELAYGAEEIKKMSEAGRAGIKFNVFTTGPPLTDNECREIFAEGNRADNSKGVEGSGHGLNFIQRVINIHGGKVGCEPTAEGNNFYFILPMSSRDK